MSPDSRYVTVSNPRCGWSGAPFASPGATSIGPISSSNKNGSKSENAALGNGRRTRKPPPSKVSILFTIPATVRPLFVCVSSVLNASFTIDINLTSLKLVFCFESRSVLFTLRCRLVTDLFQQADQGFALCFCQGSSRKLFHVAGVLP